YQRHWRAREVQLLADDDEVARVHPDDAARVLGVDQRARLEGDAIDEVVAEQVAADDVIAEIAPRLRTEREGDDPLLGAGRELHLGLVGLLRRLLLPVAQRDAPHFVRLLLVDAAHRLFEQLRLLAAAVRGPYDPQRRGERDVVE